MNENLKLLTADEAARYAARYAELSEAGGYSPATPEEILEVECNALTFYKVAGWFLELHGLKPTAFETAGLTSLHRPEGDGSDDLIFGNPADAVTYARANPLS